MIIGLGEWKLWILICKTLLKKTDLVSYSAGEELVNIYNWEEILTYLNMFQTIKPHHILNIISIF